MAKVHNHDVVYYVKIKDMHKGNLPKHLSIALNKCVYMIWYLIRYEKK